MLAVMNVWGRRRISGTAEPCIQFPLSLRRGTIIVPAHCPVADETVFSLQLALGVGLMYRALCTLEMHFVLFLWECGVQRFEYMNIVIIISCVEKVNVRCVIVFALCCAKRFIVL